MEKPLIERMQPLRDSAIILGLVLVVGSFIGLGFGTWQIYASFHPKFEYESEIHVFLAVLFFIPSLLLLLPGLLILRFSRKGNNYNFRTLKTSYITLTICIVIGGALIGIGGFIFFIEEILRIRL
jgi:hypothetical protein